MAYWEGGKTFVEAVLKMQGLGRIRELGHYPFYYYGLHLWEDYTFAAPLALLSLISFPKIFKNTQDSQVRLLQYLLAWVLIILIGLSIPIEKKLRYLLPIIPALSIMGAYWVLHRPMAPVLASLRFALLKIWRISPLLFLILISLLKLYSDQHHLELGINLFPISLTLLIIYGFSLNLSPVIRSNESYALSALFVGVASFLSVYILLASPLNVYFNRAKPFVIQVEKLKKPTEQIAFYRIGPDAEDIKFMVAFDKPLHPLFLTDLNSASDALIIAKLADFNALDQRIQDKYNVVYVGKIGHQTCLVMRHK